MRIVFAVVLLLPLLLSGCLEYIIGAPMELGKATGWKDMGIIHQNCGQTPELAAAFDSNGVLFCALAPTTGSSLRIVRYDGSFRDMSCPEISSATGLSLAVNRYDDTVHVACLSNGTDTCFFETRENDYTMNFTTGGGYSNTAIAFDPVDGKDYLVGSSATGLHVWSTFGADFFVTILAANITSTSLMINQSSEILLFHATVGGAGIAPSLVQIAGDGSFTNQYQDSDFNNSAISSGQALYFSYNNTVYTTFTADSSSNAYRAFYTISPEWYTPAFNPVAPPSHIIGTTRLAQYCPDRAMYLGYLDATSSEQTQNRIATYQYNVNSGWNVLAPFSASPTNIYHFTLAVSPSDQLWMVASVQAGMEYNLHLYRYNP